MVMTLTNHVSAAKESSIENRTYATWLWHTDKIVTEQNEVLTFLKSQKVNLLYLQINRDIPISNYQKFIKKARFIGVQVQALDGAPDWVIPTNNKPQAFIDWLSHYQKVSAKSERFSGIHLDVEPYLLDEWKNDYQLTVYRYQDLLVKTRAEAKKMRLPIHADVPFWFDEQFFSNKRYGTSRLSEWVIRVTDGISIMAYRNSSKGQNGILALTASEINFAKKVNKKVVISVETHELSELDYLSFYHLTEQDMRNTLTEVYTSYQKLKSFGGFAIHHYESWKKLVNK
jgi:hypothetical protein